MTWIKTVPISELTRNSVAPLKRSVTSFEELTAREERIRQIAERSNWGDVARWGRSYLGVLVDGGMENLYLTKHSQSIDETRGRLEEVRKGFAAAEKRFRDDQFKECLEGLTKYAPPAPGQYVFNDDIFIGRALAEFQAGDPRHRE